MSGPKLRIVLEDGREVTVPIKGKLILGRQPNRGLALDDEFLSRKHCYFAAKNKKVLVKDLGSYNGTYVNGKKIHEKCLVDPDDKIRIGHSKVFVILESSKSRKKPSLAPLSSPSTSSGLLPRGLAKAEKMKAYDAEPLTDVAALKAHARRQTKIQLPHMRADRLEETATQTNLPASVSGTLRYVKPARDEESENPTPIPSADLTVSAIMRSELLSGEDPARRAMRVIAQLPRVLNSPDDLSDYLDFALGRILEIVPAERALLMRYDRKAHRLFVKFARSAVADETNEAMRQLPVSNSITRKALRDRVSLLISDAIVDDRFANSDSVHDLQIRSVLAGPIFLKNQCLGLVYLDHSQKAHSFTEFDREFLVAATNIMGLCLSFGELRGEPWPRS